VSRPLAGLLVLDLSRAVAGPMCTMLLGDLGARVIKVEEPCGDEARLWGPPFHGADSTYFLGLNRNKESAVVDLKQSADLELVYRIADRADIAVENFRPGVAARLGVDYQSLRERNARIVYGSVSGFGQDGPDRDRPGYDLILQAASGLMHTNAQPGGPPAKAPFPIADILAALFLEQAILAALYRRERTGEGAYVETTLLDSLLAGMSTLTAAALIAGVDPRPAGPRHANIVPYQIFRCAEGYAAVGITNDRIWRRFCHALDRREWLIDPRFADNPSRNLHRDELLAMIEPLFLTRPALDWESLLREADVPCAAVRTIAEALSLACVRSIWTLDDGLRVFGNPVRIGGHGDAHAPVPKLGEHTAAIRAEFAR
jgi:crotonobetainyl-CoA:carnitine CoA-transferase CaiB-like acyl-CoA transferase